MGKNGAGLAPLHHREGCDESRLAVQSSSFSVRPGATYSVSVEYRGEPPARPRIGVLVYDFAGNQIATFPNDHWYDLPANGVWLRIPFGFIAPPRAVRAVLYIGTRWLSSWRHVAVYRER